MPFDRVNARLEFDRPSAAGFRLDLPAGASERWAPGEERTVELVRLGGSASVAGNGGIDR
jgi:urease beta subunit